MGKAVYFEDRDLELLTRALTFIREKASDWRGQSPSDSISRLGLDYMTHEVDELLRHIAETDPYDDDAGRSRP